MAAQKKKRKKGPTKTAARNLDAAEKRVRAIQLRKQGKTFAEIGTALGFSPQRAHKIVTDTRDHLNAMLVTEGAELRQQQLDEIATIKRALWKGAKKAELPKVDRLERLWTREAKLAGLDAASQLEISGKNGKPLEVSEIKVRLLERLKGLAGEDK